MINTFHSSFKPPPVPPRAGYSRTSLTGNTPLVKFLSVMLLLLMLLTFAGFLFLFYKLNLESHGSYFGDLVLPKSLQDCLNEKRGADCKNLIENYKGILEKVSEENRKSFSQIGERSFKGPAAHMVLSNQLNLANTICNSLKTNILCWDRKHSMFENVKLSSTLDMLTIEIPGIYFIFSQVTFSKHENELLLKQSINIAAPKRNLLTSFCSRTQTDLCTASTAGIFKLEQNQELYVSVSNVSFINRDACWFGLFKLH